MACRFSGSSIPPPWTSVVRCRSSIGSSRKVRSRTGRPSSRAVRSQAGRKPRQAWDELAAGPRFLSARDTFHWKVFWSRRPGAFSGSALVIEAVETTEDSVLARWRWTITAAFGLGGIAISAWGPRLPAIKASLGIGPALIGLLLAGVTVGALIGLIVSAPVLRRLGSRRCVAGALLLIAAAMSVIGLALILGSVPLVAAAFVILGLGIGVLDVVINVEGSAIERAAGRTLMPMMQ